MTRDELLSEFLTAWPLQRIRSMTLAEYSQAGSKETFTSWLESRTEDLGSIWGGSAFKFGIYHRRDQKEQKDRRGLRYEGEYAWYDKHGGSPQVAFENIRALIVQVVENIVKHDLSGIDSIDLPYVLKWKIAFLYQDFERPQIPMFYKEEAIRWSAAQRGLNGKSSLVSCLEKLGQDWEALDKLSRNWAARETWFDFSVRLWEEWQRELPRGLAAADSTTWMEDLQTGMATGRYGIFWWSKNVTGGAPVLDALRDRIDEDGSFPVLLCLGKSVRWELVIEDFATVDDYAEKDWSMAFWHRPSFEEYRDDDVGGKKAKLVFLVKSIHRLVKDAPITGIRWWKQYQAPTQDNLQPFAEWSGAETDRSELTLKESVMKPTNRILYGPPGTGKTWSTMIHAVALAERLPLSEVKSWERAAKLRPRWNELVQAGHIRFVTFHPAMTYEDFVEGLKPSSDEKSGVTYDVEMGILRELCTKALALDSGAPDSSNFDTFLEAISEKPQTLKTVRGMGFTVSYHGQKSINCIPDSSPSSSHGVNVEVIRRMIAGEVVQTHNPSYARGIADHIRSFQNNRASAPTWNPDFVLVIDEINRGNIPAIFGELITLLEPDKRLGAKEELKVVLPASRDEFGIPSNLHVLGTMNTADRSVESLDVALRRRFEFVEVLPDPALLGTTREGIDLSELLRTINERLEALLDRDHIIGHAYLMDVNDLEGLTWVFSNKILPLLQEFFYREWNKIGLVLGSGFVRLVPQANVKFAKGFDSDSDDMDRYELVPCKVWTEETFRSILNER